MMPTLFGFRLLRFGVKGKLVYHSYKFCCRSRMTHNVEALAKAGDLLFVCRCKCWLKIKCSLVILKLI